MQLQLTLELSTELSNRRPMSGDKKSKLSMKYPDLKKFSCFRLVRFSIGNSSAKKNVKTWAAYEFKANHQKKVGSKNGTFRFFQNLNLILKLMYTRIKIKKPKPARVEKRLNYLVCWQWKVSILQMTNEKVLLRLSTCSIFVTNA
jgi:hypothetical protein